MVNMTHSVGSPLSDEKLSTPSTSNQRKKITASVKKGKYFTQHVPKGNRPCLWVCFRRNFTKNFQIRKSRVEDCDDISPMLIKNNDV